MKSKNDIRIGSSCAIACETLFGFSYLFTKQVIGQASELALLGWRFLIAAIVIIACAACGVIKINIIGKPLRPVLLIATFSPVVYFIGETFGISQTTASESGAFLACIPVASLIASTLILKKKPKKNQVIGIIVTLVGVLITIFAVGAGTSLSIAGYAALLIAVIAYALYAVFVEKAEGYTGEEITLVMLSAGSVVFVSLALLEAAVTGDVASFIRLPFTNRSFLIACLYQGIGCSVLAFFLSNVAIAKIGVNKTSSFIGIATMVSIAAGVLILREPFTVFQMAGVILIITGVYIANSRF